MTRWHLGFCNDDYLPTKRGFDTFYGFYCGSEDYYYHFRRGNSGIFLPSKSPIKFKFDDIMKSSYFIAKFIGSYGYDFRDQDAPDYGANGTYSAVGNIPI